MTLAMERGVPVNGMVTSRHQVVTEKAIYQWAAAVVVAHLLLWTLPQLLWRSALPLDTTEGFAYSLQWQWGYERDPYLVSLMVALGRLLTNNHTWILYFFSQLAILAAFWAVWQLARAIGLSRLHALISMLCLEGIAFYNYSTPEFNDNVLVLPFWAWSGYFFYRACQTERLRDWVLLGACAGLATMAKHSAALLILSMLMYLVLTREGRRHWSKPGVYLGALMAFLIVLPNILWLVKHDFVTFVYASDRASISPRMQFWNHLLNPLKFVVTQSLVIMPTLGLMAFVLGRKRGRALPLDQDQWVRLFAITVLPFVVVVLCSVISGGKLPDHWGAPLYLFLGVLLLALWQPELERTQWRRFSTGVVLVFSFMLTANLIGLLWMPRFHHEMRAAFPGQAIAGEADALWKQHFPGAPLRYVDGDRWISGNISVFSPGHPVALPYFFWQFSKPGSDLDVSHKTIAKHGVMVVWTGEDSKLPAKYPNAVLLGRIPFKYVRSQQQQPNYVAVAAVPPGEATSR